MDEAGLAWCLALTMRYSGNAGSAVASHSTAKVINVLLWGHGIDAEMLRNMSLDNNQTYSSHLA
jgi:hypothetical protein